MSQRADYGHTIKVSFGWKADVRWALLRCPSYSLSHAAFVIVFVTKEMRMLGIMMRSPHRGKLAAVLGILALAGIAIAMVR